MLLFERSMSLKCLIYVKIALGQHEKTFGQYKIRTMVPNAEQDLDSVVENGFDNLGKVINDPRITPAGRVLRKYWVDELPQLINLLRGEMNLVGIRPRSERDWKYLPQKHKKEALKQKPGLMGVNYAYETAKDLQGNMEIEQDYLRLREEHPILTDICYAIRIAHNIIFKGVRSR
jgi:lipopolysaccharide/colanic/teichoic acid biosynthesis glycosyltransferase